MKCCSAEKTEESFGALSVALHLLALAASSQQSFMFGLRQLAVIRPGHRANTVTLSIIVLFIVNHRQASDQ